MYGAKTLVQQRTGVLFWVIRASVATNKPVSAYHKYRFSRW